MSNRALSPAEQRRAHLYELAAKALAAANDAAASKKWSAYAHFEKHLRAANVDSLFLALRLTSEAVLKLRTAKGLAPFDDPLPGDPATPEQDLRDAFAEKANGDSSHESNCKSPTQCVHRLR